MYDGFRKIAKRSSYMKLCKNILKKVIGLTPTIIALTLTLTVLVACTGNDNLPEPDSNAFPEPSEPVQQTTPPPSPEPEVESIDEDEPDVLPEVEEEPVDPVEQRISDIIDSMSLYEKICQMLIVTPESITGVAEVTIAGEITQASIEKYPVGGIILFSPNITSSDQVTEFNKRIQEYSTLPLFIAVDEEGGRVARLGNKLGVHSIKAMLTYEEDGLETAFENAIILSDALKDHGFNTNFAPVADVWSNSANSVIGNRAYSRDFDVAAELVAAAVRGFRESNIVASLKHFPGHGDTSEDSHYTTAYVNKTLDELRESEFLPFIAGIDAGADMVMTGHLIVPEVDELPATLSKVLISDILRGELGFEGIVITDSLAMSAVSRHFSNEFVAVTAVTAGVDILLMPLNVGETISALVAAVESGEIPESRIDESVRRILGLKISLGLIRL